MNPFPLVSIIIPSYNRAETILNSLKSILNQTYTNWECLVIDDFSTDNTVDVINQIIKNDSRFRYLLNEKNKGAQGARNTGIIHSKGDWVAFNDSDDVWLANKLRMQIDVLIEHSFKENLVIHGNCIVKDHTLNTDEYWTLNKSNDNDLKFYLKESAILYPSILTSKKFLLSSGLLDEQVPSYQEWDLALQLVKKSDFVHLDEPLFIYNKHIGDTISKDMSRDLLGYDYIRVKYKNDFISFYGESAYIESIMQNIARAARFGNWDTGKILLKKHKNLISAKQYSYWLHCFTKKINPVKTKPSAIKRIVNFIKRKIHD